MDHPENGMMDLSDLPIFLAVARSGSFVAASRQTRTPPSTTSRAVARLEHALGVRLFDRTSRRVTLTREGKHLVERADALTKELGAALSDVSARNNAPAGLVRVTAPLWIGAGRIARALMEFAAAHPKIEVDLQLSNTLVDLVESGFDLGFRAGPVDDESLVARRLWDVPFTLAASRELVKKRLRGSVTISRERLLALPVIATTGGAWTFIRKDGAREAVAIDERFRVNDPRVAIDAALRGLGIVRAPTEAVAASGLVALSCTLGDVESKPLYAVMSSRYFLPKRVRLALDWITRA